MERNAECPRCKGAGKIPIGLVFQIRCATCKGDGLVPPSLRQNWIEAQQEKDEAHGPAA